MGLCLLGELLKLAIAGDNLIDPARRAVPLKLGHPLEVCSKPARSCIEYRSLEALQLQLASLYLSNSIGKARCGIGPILVRRSLRRVRHPRGARPDNAGLRAAQDQYVQHTAVGDWVKLN